MLQHLYTLDYPGQKLSIEDNEESSHISELHTHAQMYALGDEYDLKDLKEEALWKFKMTIVAIKGHNDELKQLIEVIPTVYATTPESDRGLRNVIVATGVLNMERLTTLPEFKSVETRVPDYLIEVQAAFPEANRLQHEAWRFKENCSYCQLTDEWVFSQVVCRRCSITRTIDPVDRPRAT